MLDDRRQFLTAATLSFLSVRDALAQVSDLPLPNPGLFQSGDFVFPKKPGAYVPYNSGTANSPMRDRDLWQDERDAYVKTASLAARDDPLAIQRLTALREMDYREFIAVYAGAQQPGIPGLYSGNGVYVGHCGILQITPSKELWVIEALWEKGVVRKKYAEWLLERSGQVVWLARLRQLDADQRSKIAIEAAAQVGKPYNFWNFDLNDDSSFYCSKLAWLSVYRSLGFAMDGKTSPQRLFWFSPKQMLNLPVLERLHDPGPYATS